MKDKLEKLMSISEEGQKFTSKQLIEYLGLSNSNQSYKILAVLMKEFEDCFVKCQIAYHDEDGRHCVKGYKLYSNPYTYIEDTVDVDTTTDTDEEYYTINEDTLKINTIEYFNVKVDMIKIDEALYIGEYDKGETYLVESIFSGDMFLDVCTDDEILLNYGIDVNEISYFTLN